MSHVPVRLRSLLLAALLLPLAACGGSQGGKVMADNPIYEYQPPEDLHADGEDDDDGDEADDDTDEG